MINLELPRVGRANGSQPFLSYSRAPKDKDGWINASDYLPMDFYLVDMLIKGKQKIIKGWINFNHWEALRLKVGDIVSHWRPGEIREIRDNPREPIRDADYY